MAGIGLVGIWCRVHIRDRTGLWALGFVIAALQQPEMFDRRFGILNMRSLQDMLGEVIRTVIKQHENASDSERCK